MTLEPAHPNDEGLAASEPAADEQEGAHVLANEARPTLHDRGFDDEQIDEWARAYVEHNPQGTVERFLAWVEQKES